MRVGLVRRPKRPRAPGLSVRDYLVLLPRALQATYEDGCLGFAKGAAYSAILSFFPLLTTVATILVHTRANWVTHNISLFLRTVLPPGTEQLVFEYFAVRGQQPVLLPVTAVLLSIWAASGATVSLMQGFKAAYRIPTGRPFVQERTVAILLVFSAFIPVLVASALVLLGGRAEAAVGNWLGLLPRGARLKGGLAAAGLIVRYLISLGSIALGAAILFYVGPNRPKRWHSVVPGAIVATVLWLGATLGFGWYVRNIANYNVMYGSIAAAILLLVWMYVLAVIAFIGCEYNAVCERAAGSAAR